MSPIASSASGASRRRASGASRQTSSRPVPPPRRSSPASGWGGASARRASSRSWSQRSRTPTSARARWANGCSRSTRAAAGWTSSSSVARALPAAVRADAGRARAAHAGRGGLDPARRRFFSWLTLPGASSRPSSRRAPRRGESRSSRASFFPDGRGGENLRLSFSRVEDELIDEGIGRLAALVADATGGRRQ